jgi:ribonuclease P protein subunit POP4
MITPENIINHELIGLDTKIIESTNNQIVGLGGKIMDETRSTFTIQTQNGLKMFPKEHSKWKFTINETQCVIDGSMISKRPEERLKVKKND